MNLNFKPAVKADIPIVLAMMEDFYKIDQYPFNAALTELNLNEFITNASLGKIWIIMLEGTSIGYFVLSFGFSFEFKGKIALLDEFFIQAEHRNQGIGRKVMEFLLSAAPSFQIKTILLEVEKHNIRALQLYGKMGFLDHKRLIMSKYLMG
jgi:diamine N-acetyltransferase